MFDVDGTLTETMKIYEECFVRTLAEIYGFAGVETDWSRYKNTTDSGIFHEIHLVHTGRLPSNAEVHIFGGALSLCSEMRHPDLRLLQSLERASCFLSCPPAQTIGYLLLRENGVILRASRWPAPG